jgi:hypothetical protein
MKMRISKMRVIHRLAATCCAIFFLLNCHSHHGVSGVSAEAQAQTQAQSQTQTQQQQTCSADETERDPALREMTYDVGEGPQKTWVYIEPDVTSFYQMEPPAHTKVVPKFQGFQGKFINLSNQPTTLYWYVHTKTKDVFQKITQLAMQSK